MKENQHIINSKQFSQNNYKFLSTIGLLVEDLSLLTSSIWLTISMITVGVLLAFLSRKVSYGLAIFKAKHYKRYYRFFAVIFILLAILTLGCFLSIITKIG